MVLKQNYDAHDEDAELGASIAAAMGCRYLDPLRARARARMVVACGEMRACDELQMPLACVRAKPPPGVALARKNQFRIARG